MPAPESPSIKSDLRGIGWMLRVHQLQVPLYQRSYSWGKDQVEAFWQDLKASSALPNPSYFMGAIVVAPDDKSVVVIDGQQRLVTTSLLLAAIRDFFVERGDTERAGVIEAEYLATKSLRSANRQAKLTLNPDDDNFYRSRVIEGRDAAEELTSHRRLEKAYKYLRERVWQEANEAGAYWPDRLIEWVEYLEELVQLIVVTVAEETDAYLVFETLNGRNLELSVADLLKNYLLGLTRNEIAPNAAAWSRAVAEFEIEDTEQTFTTFIRHYWNSMHGATRERELYRSLKRRVRSAPHAAELISGLEAASPLYAALLDSSHRVWAELETPPNLVSSLLGLGLEQNRPLMLAALLHFDRDELARLFDFLLSAGVRGLVTGGIGGGTFERVYADAAVKISERRLQTAAQVVEELGPFLPTDNEFSEAFRVRRINRSRVAAYLLAAVESHIKQEPHPAWQPSDISELVLTLIVPRRPAEGDWPAIPPEALPSTTFRLGNMVLLSRDEHRRLDRKWHSAGLQLAQAARPLARIAGSYPEWSVDVIDERQVDIADRAPSIWPIS